MTNALNKEVDLRWQIELPYDLTKLPKLEFWDEYGKNCLIWTGAHTWNVVRSNGKDCNIRALKKKLYREYAFVMN